MNENEQESIPIQIAPHTMWNGKEKQKISTKLLAVECAKIHANEVKQRLFTKLLNVPESMELSSTRYFKFIPFTASGAITDKMIRAGIYLQNGFLLQTLAITIVNMDNIDWIVPNTSISFRRLILHATEKNANDCRFSSIEMGVLDNKAHLITSKESHEKAIVWIDSLTTELENLCEPKDFWKKLAGFEYTPTRINRPICSDAHQAYANFLDQTFAPLVGDKIEESGTKTAPQRLSYSRVVYGNDGNHNPAGTGTAEQSKVSYQTSEPTGK